MIQMIHPNSCELLNHTPVWYLLFGPHRDDSGAYMLKRIIGQLFLKIEARAADTLQLFVLHADETDPAR